MPVRLLGRMLLSHVISFPVSIPFSSAFPFSLLSPFSFSIVSSNILTMPFGFPHDGCLRQFPVRDPLLINSAHAESLLFLCIVLFLMPYSSLSFPSVPRFASSYCILHSFFLDSHSVVIDLKFLRHLSLTRLINAPPQQLTWLSPLEVKSKFSLTSLVL